MEFCELWHKRFCSCSKFELPAKFSIGHALLLTSIFLIYTNLFLPMLFYFPKSLLSCFPPVLCGVQLRAISADNNMFQILKNTKGLRLSKSYYSTVCTSSSHESMMTCCLGHLTTIDSVHCNTVQSLSTSKIRNDNKINITKYILTLYWNEPRWMTT